MVLGRLHLGGCQTVLNGPHPLESPWLPLNEPGRYAALTFGAEIRKHKIEASMGRVRTSYDNAPAESFFATLTKDPINRYRGPTRPDAQHAIFDFIERWYNNERLHSTPGYLSPAEYELLLTAA